MTARRWIAILGGALVVSLGLNLFIGGVVAGRLLGHRGDFDWQLSPDRMKVNIERVMGALPDADAKILGDLFEAQLPDIAERFQALQQARRGVGGALRAQPFDPASLASAYDAMQARSQELQAAIHDVVKSVLLRLSADGRLAVAERRWRRQ